MKIKTTYRDQVKTVATNFRNSSLHKPGVVRLTSIGYCNGNQKHYTIEIEAQELMRVAFECLNQINDLAHTDYKIVNHQK